MMVGALLGEVLDHENAPKCFENLKKNFFLVAQKPFFLAY
jgi:hypothetical protein